MKNKDQLYYAFGNYEEHWLTDKKMSVSFKTGYKDEDGNIDEDPDRTDYDKLEEIFKDIGEDHYSIEDMENTHAIIEYPDKTKESMMEFIKNRLEANGYIYEPEFTCY